MPTPADPTRLGMALAYADEAHQHQTRKITGIPYVSHLLGVASLALEFGATEDEAIAALLHDVAEDQGGTARLVEVSARFGPEVARIVAFCSDSLDTNPALKAPWRERKQRHLAHLAEADASVRLVVACDKLHNIQNLLRDLRTRGPAIWLHFKSKPQDQLWYYQAVLDALRAAEDRPFIDELAWAFGRLKAHIPD